MEEDPLDLYTEPEDKGLDKQIWSKNKLVSPISYMNSTLLSSNLVGYAPPPTFLKYNDQLKREPLSKEEIMDKIEIMSKGGLKFCDERVSEKMKGVVGEVLS